MTTLENSGVVASNELVVEAVSPDLTTIKGNVYCKDKVVIEVDKEIRTVRREKKSRRKLVATTHFRYHAHRMGLKGGNILRCESGHAEHRLTPHRHDYPDLCGQDVVTDFADPERIPTLKEFIEMVDEWRADHPLHDDP
jgi:hypothetical protein